MKRKRMFAIGINAVASSREDAWIETIGLFNFIICASVASSREDAWIETFYKIA